MGKHKIGDFGCSQRKQPRRWMRCKESVSHAGELCNKLQVLNEGVVSKLVSIGLATRPGYHWPSVILSPGMRADRQPIKCRSCSIPHLPAITPSDDNLLERNTYRITLHSVLYRYPTAFRYRLRLLLLLLVILLTLLFG